LCRAPQQLRRALLAVSQDISRTQTTRIWRSSGAFASAESRVYSFVRQDLPAGSSTDESICTAPAQLTMRAKRRLAMPPDDDRVTSCDRLIMPRLSPDELAQLSAGSLSLDAMTKAYVQSGCRFRFVTIVDGQTAATIEREIKGRGLFES